MDPSVYQERIKALGARVIENRSLQEGTEVGSGSFGTVYHDIWMGQDVAIKRIKSSALCGDLSKVEKLRLEFLQEAEILARLDHYNVLPFFGVIEEPGGTLATVTPYIQDGTLRELLFKKRRLLGPMQRIILAIDVARGMKHIHSRNIVHFDLKPANIFVDMTNRYIPNCKVGDLGLSKIKQGLSVSTGARGTLPWMAPELLNGSSSLVSDKVDVYSFGVILWEILTSKVPYFGMKSKAIIEGVVNNKLRPLVPVGCDPRWEELMTQCWDANPLARPSFTDICRRLDYMRDEDYCSLLDSYSTIRNKDTLPVIKDKEVEEGKKLGSGVYQGKWCGRNVTIERKEFTGNRGGRYTENALKYEFLRQANILINLHHQNVVTFHGVIKDDKRGDAIVTEYPGESLRQVLLSKKRHLDHHQRLLVAIDVAIGMKYLHQKKMVHFDLKSTSIFVDLTNPSNPISKVGGLSLLQAEQDLMVFRGARGTDLPWIAPELLNGNFNSKDIEKVDVYSFGVLLWEILNGKEPYAGMDFMAVIDGVLGNTLRPPVPDSCDPQWKRLMEMCWVADPMARPSFALIVRKLKSMCHVAGLHSHLSLKEIPEEEEGGEIDPEESKIDEDGDNAATKDLKSAFEVKIDFHKKDSASDIYQVRASVSIDQPGHIHQKDSASDIYQVRASVSVEESGRDNIQQKPNESDIYGIVTSITGDEHISAMQDGPQKKTEESASDIYEMEATTSFNINSMEVGHRYDKESVSDIYGDLEASTPSYALD